MREENREFGIEDAIILSKSDYSEIEKLLKMKLQMKIQIENGIPKKIRINFKNHYHDFVMRKSANAEFEKINEINDNFIIEGINAIYSDQYDNDFFIHFRAEFKIYA